MTLMFRFVGHPFVDVGVATLCAAAGVTDPAALTVQAVEDFVEELSALYLNPVMSGYLGYVVFANARFANPAQLKPQFDEQRRAKLMDVLTLWKPGAAPSLYEAAAAEDERCVFSGDQATVRVSRMYVPLTTDESNINFVPEGVPMLAVAGWCLMALLAMPMGGLASKGKMWIVHSVNPTGTLHFARLNLQRNRSDFQMQGLAKRPNYKFARTYLIRDLVEVTNFQQSVDYPLTTYLFTSSGQKSEVTIDHLTSPVLRFVRQARRQLPDAWNRIVQRAERANTDATVEDGVVTYNERNYFYEDLFSLPAGAHRFLDRYLLRQALRGKPTGDAKNDPRYTYSAVEESDLVSWSLTELFLREVMGMEKQRIEAIKAISDRIAQYILNQDSRLFKQLFYARTGDHFRQALLKADSSAIEPIFGFDDYILAFFTDNEQGMLRFDWYLARDLMMVRVIEALHQANQVEIARQAAAEAPEAVAESTAD